MRYGILFISFLFCQVTGFTQSDTARDSLVRSREIQEMTDAGETADSVARAELAQYQKAHRGRLSRSQLNLKAYKRNMEVFADVRPHSFFVFDYDYNLPVGGVVYLLHFTVTVSPRTGRTAFKTL